MSTDNGFPGVGNYRGLFEQYWGFSVAFVTSQGIRADEAPDVAAAILARFWERDFLAVYSPEHRSARPGVSGFVTFKSFLSGFLAVYCRHHRDKQRLRDTRAPLFADLSEAGLDAVTDDHANAVCDAEASRVWAARIRSELDAVGLAEFWDVLVSAEAAGVRVNAAAIARYAGIPVKAAAGALERVREQISISRSEAAA